MEEVKEKKMIRKFAHITDCHIGAWRNPKLRELNLKAFENAIMSCINEHVDFIVISGDFFDVNIPQLGPVKRAVQLIRLAKSHGIQTYMIYGSHDFAMTNVSMIDILHSTDLFIKPTGYDKDGELIRLQFFTDARTKAKITGISGRKMGLDREIYENLDKPGLESEDGFKILLLHKGISELTTDKALVKDCIPLSYLPRGFDYYGGGHIHKRIEGNMGENKVIYPGPIFGSTYEDLEQTAKGERRGFYIISFDDKLIDCKFIEVKVADIVSQEIQVDGMSATELDRKLGDVISALDEVKDKIILVKVVGVFNGRLSDIDFGKFGSNLLSRGAMVPILNTNNLASSSSTICDISTLDLRGTSKSEIETSIFKENIQKFKMDSALPQLVKEKMSLLCKDEEMAAKLLDAFRAEKIENETVGIYDERINSMAKSLLSLSN
ncbi:MAG TPA: DNA repair exonuclease [Nitrososphaeraceae archaeon]